MPAGPAFPNHGFRTLVIPARRTLQAAVDSLLCWARVLGVEASMLDDARQTIGDSSVVTNTMSEVLLIKTEEAGPDPQQ